MTDDIAELVKGLSKDMAALDPRWVPGYEGHYFLTNDGSVHSVARTFTRMNRGARQVIPVNGRTLALGRTRKGYASIRLYKNNAARSFEVHRLVCRVYHGEPPLGNEAAHYDGDRMNAAASNLRWATRSENHADKRLHGSHLTGEAVPKAKLTRMAAMEVCRRALYGEGSSHLGRVFGISERAVRQIRDGKLWADCTAALRSHLQQQRGDVA